MILTILKICGVAVVVVLALCFIVLLIATTIKVLKEDKSDNG
jgi:tellurite resistance protein TehA-like permease